MKHLMPADAMEWVIALLFAVTLAMLIALTVLAVTAPEDHRPCVEWSTRPLLVGKVIIMQRVCVRREEDPTP